MRAMMILWLCALCLGGLWAKEQKFEVPRQYSVVLNLPEQPGAYPCVVLCPGRGYHKDLPLMKQSAELLAQAGFIAIRFDWSFFINNTAPSEDFGAERADILRALDIAKTNATIDTARIYLVGKSLGSVVAYWEFNANPIFKGIVLQTPIIPNLESAESYYPGLKNETRPISFVLGDEDIHNCTLSTLYKYISVAEKPIPVSVLSGGHGFQKGEEPLSDQLKQQNQDSLDMAIKSTVFWLKAMDQ